MSRRSQLYLSFLVIILFLKGPQMSNAAENPPDFDTLWNYDQPAETAQKFQALLPQAEKDSDRQYYLELLTQIARTHSLRRQFAEAHALLDQVEKELKPEWKRAEVRYLLERGRSFNSAQAPEKALPLFVRAWKIALEAGLDFYAIDAAHMIAIAEKPENQLAWNLKALALVEKTPDPRAQKWAGSLYNNIGWTYHEQGNFAEALGYFEKCLAWHEVRKTAEPRLIAKWSVARALRSLNRLETALDQQLALAAERQSLTLAEDGYVAEEIAECLYALKRETEAVPYFAQAYQILSQDSWLLENEGKRLERLKLLSTP